jgi:hypothetical protein
LDAKLNPSRRGYLHVVQEFSSRLALNTIYENSIEVPNAFFRVTMPQRSLEGVVSDLSDEVEWYCEHKASTDVSPEAVVSVATLDKNGGVMRKPNEDTTGALV